MICAGLRSVVRGTRAIRRGFRECVVAVEREVAVDLAGRDVMEAGHASLTRSFEKGLCAEHVRSEEEARVQHRQTVVRLGREIDDHVNAVVAEQPVYEVELSDVSLDEFYLLA